MDAQVAEPAYCGWSEGIPFCVTTYVPRVYAERTLEDPRSAVIHSSKRGKLSSLERLDQPHSTKFYLRPKGTKDPKIKDSTSLGKYLHPTPLYTIQYRSDNRLRRRNQVSLS